MTDSTARQPAPRSKKGIIFIAVAIVAFILFSRHVAVKTIECTPEIMQHRPDVVMLGAWWCSYCYQAKEYFQNNHINYCEYDMENTPRGKQLYEQNGGGAIPLFLIGKYQLQGFIPEQIDAAIAEIHHPANQ